MDEFSWNNFTTKQHIKRNSWDWEALLWHFWKASFSWLLAWCTQCQSTPQPALGVGWFAAGKDLLPCLPLQKFVQRKPSCCSQWCTCLLPITNVVDLTGACLSRMEVVCWFGAKACKCCLSSALCSISHLWMQREACSGVLLDHMLHHSLRRLLTAGESH